MSMDNLLNQHRRHAGLMDSSLSHASWGIVSSYNPTDTTCKVYLQPENKLSGWLPVMFPTVGNGIGLLCPPNVGQQVVILFDGGSRDDGIILGGSFSDLSPVPKINGNYVQSGEIALIGGVNGGSYIYLEDNGNIAVTSTTSFSSTVGGTSMRQTPSGTTFINNVTIQGNLDLQGNQTTEGNIQATGTITAGS